MSTSGAGLAPVEKKRPGWVVGGATVISFVALLYVIEAYSAMTRQSLDQDGIHPREVDGLLGILFAPLLHASWEHLYANTLPALVLGFVMTLLGMSRFVWATVIVWILGGFGTWLIGGSGITIGASGLIFGWLTFLIVFGFFTRHAWQIIVGIIVFLVYGGILWGALPGTFGVSWQGHLCGGIAGVFAAYVLSGPERTARQRGRGGAAQQLSF